MGCIFLGGGGKGGCWGFLRFWGWFFVGFFFPPPCFSFGFFFFNFFCLLSVVFFSTPTTLFFHLCKNALHRKELKIMQNHYTVLDLSQRKVTSHMPGNLISSNKSYLQHTFSLPTVRTRDVCSTRTGSINK